jgi:hypothetical protein
LVFYTDIGTLLLLGGVVEPKLYFIFKELKKKVKKCSDSLRNWFAALKISTQNIPPLFVGNTCAESKRKKRKLRISKRTRYASKKKIATEKHFSRIRSSAEASPVLVAGVAALVVAR